ncbi:toxin BrnT [Candidatus Termititenax persephonae]|uniref:Toxin BrnT n=1 Tax=Candidatus Termititenax persephonae TaxID=2218525 RepID=A0A388TIE6_9BACT|nr:toxin BrnT [Candidatus Termititenax persephonae]
MEDELILRDFEWDEQKNEANIINRGLDFEFASLIFLDNDRLRYNDNRKNYGELRYQTIGKAFESILFVAYTIRGSKIRIISARQANKKERSIYENSKENY